jgi:hypothetical protein
MGGKKEPNTRYIMEKERENTYKGVNGEEVGHMPGGYTSM